jgi:hypothetical protein
MRQYRFVGGDGKKLGVRIIVVITCILAFLRAGAAGVG